MIVQDYVEQYWKIGNYNEHYFCFVNYYYFWIARRGRFDDGIKYDWSTISKSYAYNIWKHKRRLFRILELCTLSQWPRSLINSSLWNEVDKLDGKETSFPRWERCDIRVIPLFSVFLSRGAQLDCSTNIEELAIILSSRSLHWLVNWKIKRCTLDWTSTRWRC